MLTCVDEINLTVSPPQLDLFLSSWNIANLFSLDRRKERRKPFPIRTNVEINGVSWRGRGKNISTSGLSLSVEDHPSFSINQTLHLCLINHSFHFWLEGTVRGIREVEQQDSANLPHPIVNLAIEFTHVTEREKQVLASLIEGYQERSVTLFMACMFTKHNSLHTFLEQRCNTWQTGGMQNPEQPSAPFLQESSATFSSQLLLPMT